MLHTTATLWWSRGELDRRSAEVAGRMAAAGLVSGDRVLVSAPASAALVVAHVAALRLGLVVVPANVAYTERELVHIATDAGVAGAVIDDPVRAGWISRALPTAVVSATDASGLPAGQGSTDDTVLDEVDPGSPAVIAYTSGTTGHPKGAVLTHANLLAGAAAVASEWEWTARDRLVLALPLFHAHGLLIGLHGTLLVGGSAVLQPRFEPEAVLGAVDEHRATMFFGVPTMYARLADHDQVGRLARLRLCVSGSAPLSPALWERMRDRAGVEVLERYGTTETLLTVSNPYRGERRPGSVGLPLPGVELRLVDGPDGEGEVTVRGPSVFAGYLGSPGFTEAALDADGWFRTGDLGRTDPDGYLRIVGRASELVISGGYNVYPREVEDVLCAHSCVAEAAVVGTPSPEWGEIVTAVVVAAPGVAFDEADVLAHARRQLAAYKVPRLVRVVDSLPRNALGKVVKKALSAGTL